MIRLRWVALIAAGLCVGAIILTACVMELREIRALSRVVDERMDRLVELTRNIQVLKEKVIFYKTPEGIARLAREQFNMVYPDEQMYR
ncbi:MAG: septum formation initiator family protein, partial [Synergistota bacterium]|nr:septum formation initiator family protein [Synergistota bacterium]